MDKENQAVTAQPGVTEDLEKASLETVYERLETSVKGLTSAEVTARLEKYGRNELVTKEVSDLEKFLRFFWGPIAWMIEAAAVLSVLMGHWADNTFFGRTASLVASAGGGASHSQKATTQIGDFLIAVSVILCVILVGFELYQDLVVHHAWQWSKLADIARMVLVLLIASIPVAMPTVMTVTNSLGAQALAKKKAIVSRLEAIEELAGVDILCSDKTGTLTKNILTLGEPILFTANTADQLFLGGALASEKGSEDAIDVAVRDGVKDPKAIEAYQVTKFVPFDPVGKRTEGNVTDAEGKALKYTKGAPQVIIDLCKLDADSEAKASKTVADLAAKGMRALGVAESVDDGKSWNFLGILSMLDPPRDDSKATIQQAKEHGLQVKMATGDDVAIGSEISGQLGMGTNLIAAADLFTKDMDMDHMPAKVEQCVETADGFGRVFPEHKYGIVKALQNRGHVVAMTGDGVNDAPALKQADCGIAVSGATDAARAAAALILTAPGLSTVIEAIDEARMIFERILNYITFRVAMTLDIMFVVVLATVFFGFSPLTPVMIILLALLDDIPIMTIAYDNTLLPKEPVRWHMRQLLLVSGFMGLMAVAQSFGLLLIGMAWMGNPEWQSWVKLTQEQIQTAVFLQIVAGGHLLLFVMRSRGFFLARPWPAMPMFLAIVGTQIFAVLMCGFGWFVTAIPWTIIGLIWIYMLVWMFVLDLVKLGVYSRIRAGNGHPKWYTRFMKNRHPTHSLG